MIYTIEISSTERCLPYSGVLQADTTFGGEFVGTVLPDQVYDYDLAVSLKSPRTMTVSLEYNIVFKIFASETSTKIPIQYFRGRETNDEDNDRDSSLPTPLSSKKSRRKVNFLNAFTRI